MRVMIVDDEPLARSRLKRMLLGSNYQVCAEADHGEQALQLCQSHHPDIILLDIRMPGTDGLEVARALQRMTPPPAIIFTTAYDDYALEAFKVKAQQYLLKPIRKEDLLTSLAAAHALTQAQHSYLKGEETELSLPCHRGSELIRVPLHTVAYCQAEHKYVTVHSEDSECLTELTLKEIEQQHADVFIRIHRNTLVNRSYLRTLTRDEEGHYQVSLVGTDALLPVSRRLAIELKEYLKSR